MYVGEWLRGWVLLALNCKECGCVFVSDENWLVLQMHFSHLQGRQA